MYLDSNCIGTIQGGPIRQVSFYTRDVVCDEKRGILVFSGTTWSFLGLNQYAAYMGKKKMHKLALILESPHKDEYDNNFVPLRPANGKTGIKINTKLNRRPFITQLSSNADYEVYIMNPVQLQCSCYYQFQQNNIKCTTSNTQKVFRRLFNATNKRLRHDFIQRLQSYGPDFVINCTTSSLKPLVENAIKVVYPGGSNCLDKHPVMW